LGETSWKEKKLRELGEQGTKSAGGPRGIYSDDGQRKPTAKQKQKQTKQEKRKEGREAHRSLGSHELALLCQCASGRRPQRTITSRRHRDKNKTKPNKKNSKGNKERKKMTGRTRGKWYG
jgi:predicted dehydrogenase